MSDDPATLCEYSNIASIKYFEDTFLILLGYRK